MGWKVRNVKLFWKLNLHYTYGSLFYSAAKRKGQEMKLYTYREYLANANSKGQEHNAITNGPNHLHVWTAQMFIENIFRFEYVRLRRSMYEVTRF